MGLFEMFSEAVNNKVEHLLEVYKKELRNMSDSQVLRRLSDLENRTGSGDIKMYDMTYKEAKRRGLM